MRFGRRGVATARRWDSLNAADACDEAVFIGTSLRDHHVRDAATAIASSRPVAFVSPRGRDPQIPGLIEVQQTASEFLMSTLPTALRSSASLSSLSGHHTTSPGLNVLSEVRTATNVAEDRDRRCRAIENLDQAGLTLDEALISQLVGDHDIDVARFALGLVAAFPTYGRLLTTAETSPHANDPAFVEELDLLRSMIESRR